MTTLRFDAVSVARLMTHAQRCNEWQASYWDESGEAPHPQIVFVHDQGLYLMSNGVPGLPLGGGEVTEGGNVAYAQGFDPSKVEFDDWWDAARDAVGGDDFAEYFDFDELLPIPEDATAFIVEVTPDYYAFAWERAARPTRRTVSA